ncbi:unnamed protein product [Allacma fusca]|uniref:Uncharacterized protein n=1 Tax=Allacma fusca TaxID=39272 RepID=A0A8J2KYT6_9HEXA|nr:unnamed protein product [Allacma fusca]
MILNISYQFSVNNEAGLESYNTTRYVIDDIAGKLFRWGKNRNG